MFASDDFFHVRRFQPISRLALALTASDGACERANYICALCVRKKGDRRDHIRVGSGLVGAGRAKQEPVLFSCLCFRCSKKLYIYIYLQHGDSKQSTPRDETDVRKGLIGYAIAWPGRGNAKTVCQLK